MKRKPVEAWVLVWPDGFTTCHRRKKDAERYAETNTRIVHLVEADPRAAAVVRAAVKWAETVDRRAVELMIDVDGPLYDAVERLRPKRAKGAK
jgi:K+-sensing histidine kinase KdpD